MVQRKTQNRRPPIGHNSMTSQFSTSRKVEETPLTVNEPSKLTN